MSVKIITDTNAVLNKKSPDQLLGSRKLLQKVVDMPDAELVVPAMVIDEIIFQKFSMLQLSKQSLIDNAYYKRLPINTRQAIESNDLDEFKLRSDQSIPFIEIGITDDSGAFAKIHKLAVNHEAPFAKYNPGDKTNTDKGFKDACIAITVDEYLASIEDDRVIFVSSDGRLSEYFANNDRVVCVSNVDDAISQIEPATTETVLEDKRSNAIIKPLSQERLSIQALLTDFRNTGSFAETHGLIPKLEKVVKSNKFTDDDYMDILASIVQNNQIAWLLGDEDVRGFILPIFTKYGDRLDIESYNIIAPGLDLESKTPEPELIDYEEAAAAYEVWAELQADIARGK
jgi:hypothetical protein